MKDILFSGVWLSTVIKYILFFFFCAVSILASVMCTVDKINAKKRKKRIPESDLLLVSALGGSLFMYLTMIIIRHKTKHPKFMAGLPCMIFLHLSVVWLILI